MNAVEEINPGLVPAENAARGMTQEAPSALCPFSRHVRLPPGGLNPLLAIARRELAAVRHRPLRGDVLQRLFPQWAAIEMDGSKGITHDIRSPTS